MQRRFLRILLEITLVFLAFVLASKYYHCSPFYKKIEKAVAIVRPTKGNTASGKVTFFQKSDGVLVKAEISGLSEGKHGFHIHEFGDCGCDDAVCAGGHFNPANKPHGGPHSAERHIGDFGNLDADKNGNAKFELLFKGATLNGPDSYIGRSVMIHADPDDLVSQPTGNAGARIGCGSIGIAESSLSPKSNPNEY